jgi:hypothetical protein
MAGTDYDSKYRIYALANVALFLDQLDVIQRLVLGALHVSVSPRRRVSISPAGGWFDYNNLDELWNRRSPPALPSKDEAVKAAEDILSRIEKACSDANPDWPKTLRGRALLPPVNLLQRVTCDARVRPDGSAWDHWLYRAQPRLPLDGGSTTRVPVFGSQVEVRIGHRGMPVSVCSRWTPLAQAQKLVDRSPYVARADGEPATANKPDPLLAFLLEGEAVPQFYLAPYYFDIDTHGASGVSASPYSLTVDVAPTKVNAETTIVAALAQGGSGDYIYNWARYSMSRYEEPLRVLGPGRTHSVVSAGARATAASIELESGACIVVVNVKDRATGAFKHQAAQIYPSLLPILNDDSAAATA